MRNLSMQAGLNGKQYNSLYNAILDKDPSDRLWMMDVGGSHIEHEEAEAIRRSPEFARYAADLARRDETRD